MGRRMAITLGAIGGLVASQPGVVVAQAGDLGAPRPEGTAPVPERGASDAPDDELSAEPPTQPAPAQPAPTQPAAPLPLTPGVPAVPPGYAQPGATPTYGSVPPPAAAAGQSPQLLRPPPIEMETVERPRTGLIIAGAAAFAASYLTGVFVVYADYSEDEELDGSEPLLIPVVGPFLLIAELEDEQVTPFLLIDGLAQAAGLTMLAVGILVPREVEQPVARATLAPLIGPHVAGGTLSLSL